MRVIVEADGGSRGNPGPAGYGAVVTDAESGSVLAERAESIGRATNNVAEYSGLIAGLEAAAAVGATEVAVQMDSKLVVEQMTGRWQVKHPDMRPLARRAQELRGPFDSVTFRWIPREQNKHADRLANEAMDAAASGTAVHVERITTTQLGFDAVPEAGAGTSKVSFQVAADVRQRAEDVAAQRGVSVSQLAREALEAALDDARTADAGTGSSIPR